MKRKRVQAAMMVAAVIVAAVFPLVVSNAAIDSVAIFTLMYVAMASAWNILGGFTGYVSLGHASFFGVGAYAFTILCHVWHVPGGWITFAMLPVAGVVAALIAIPFGWVALRTRKHTFVVITIAYLFIFQLLAYNLTGLTNGSAGLGSPIPSWTGSFFNIPFFYVALALALIVIAVAAWIRSSRLGLHLLAIRDDEDRALGLGIKTGRLKLSAFVIAALFIAMAGALYAYYITYVYPPFAMNPLDDLAMALMSFTGGVGTIAGPIIGALLVEPSQQYFTVAFQSGLNLVTYGGLFLVVILLIPRGLWPTLRDFVASRQSRQRVPQPPAAETSVLSSEGGGQ